MKTTEFSTFDINLSIVSLIFLTLDLGTDIALVIWLFLDGYSIAGIIALVLVAIALFTVQIFNFKWHADDKTLTGGNLAKTALFLSPFDRYCKVIQYGMRYKETTDLGDLEKALRASNDAHLLRLFITFLESVPMTTLQVFLIFYSGLGHPLLVASAVISLVSSGWTIAAYRDNLMAAYKSAFPRQSSPVLLNTFSQMFVILARVAAMCLFSTLHQYWIFLLLGVHWIIMAAWVTFLNPNFGEDSCDKRCLNMVSGYMYCFTYLDYKESHPRCRTISFHTIMLIEDAILVAVWFATKYEQRPWLDVLGLSFIFGAHVIGAVLMFIDQGINPVPESYDGELSPVWLQRFQFLRDRKPRRHPPSKSHRPAYYDDSDSYYDDENDHGFNTITSPKTETWFNDALGPGKEIDLDKTSESSYRSPINRGYEDDDEHTTYRNKGNSLSALSQDSGVVDVHASNNSVSYKISPVESYDDAPVRKDKSRRPRSRRNVSHNTTVSPASTKTDISSPDMAMMTPSSLSTSRSKLQDVSLEQSSPVSKLDSSAVEENIIPQETPQRLNTSGPRDDRYSLSPGLQKVELSPLDPGKLLEEAKTGFKKSNPNFKETDFDGFSPMDTSSLKGKYKQKNNDYGNKPVAVISGTQVNDPKADSFYSPSEFPRQQLEQDRPTTLTLKTVTNVNQPKVPPYPRYNTPVIPPLARSEDLDSIGGEMTPVFDNTFRPVYSVNNGRDRLSSNEMNSDFTSVTPIDMRPSLSFMPGRENRRFRSPIPSPVNRRLSWASDGGRTSRMSFMSVESFADYESENPKPSKFRYYTEGLYDDIANDCAFMSTPQERPQYRCPPSLDLPFIDDGASVCTEDMEVIGYSSRPRGGLDRDRLNDFSSPFFPTTLPMTFCEIPNQIDHSISSISSNNDTLKNASSNNSSISVYKSPQGSANALQLDRSLSSVADNSTLSAPSSHGDRSIELSPDNRTGTSYQPNILHLQGSYHPSSQSSSRYGYSNQSQADRSKGSNPRGDNSFQSTPGSRRSNDSYSYSSPGQYSQSSAGYSSSRESSQLSDSYSSYNTSTPYSRDSRNLPRDDRYLSDNSHYSSNPSNQSYGSSNDRSSQFSDNSRYGSSYTQSPSYSDSSMYDSSYDNDRQSQATDRYGRPQDQYASNKRDSAPSRFRNNMNRSYMPPVLEEYHESPYKIGSRTNSSNKAGPQDTAV